MCSFSPPPSPSRPHPPFLSALVLPNPLTIALPIFFLLVILCLLLSPHPSLLDAVDFSCPPAIPFSLLLCFVSFSVVSCCVVCLVILCCTVFIVILCCVVLCLLFLCCPVSYCVSSCSVLSRVVSCPQPFCVVQCYILSCHFVFLVLCRAHLRTFPVVRECCFVRVV